LIEKRPFFGSKKREKFSKINEKIAQNGKNEQKIGIFCKDFSLHTFLDCAILTKNRVFSFQNSIFSRQKFRKNFREFSHFKILFFEPKFCKKTSEIFRSFFCEKFSTFYCQILHKIFSDFTPFEFPFFASRAYIFFSL